MADFARLRLAARLNFSTMQASRATSSASGARKNGLLEDSLEQTVVNI
ncbi:hypothetical protein PLANPX_2900 [Lacipirellula parvula]|uniref:Uncharacterized protein n=1 Tax=Lacipirellula parvula TaxID=2650471 RepID=A0A5K7X9S6_9BACT|nr:hypothetical protein PLANPX_2900 [Lacipirellula parvula]